MAKISVRRPMYQDVRQPAGFKTPAPSAYEGVPLTSPSKTKARDVASQENDFDDVDGSDDDDGNYSDEDEEDAPCWLKPFFMWAVVAFVVCVIFTAFFFRPPHGEEVPGARIRADGPDEVVPTAPPRAWNPTPTQSPLLPDEDLHDRNLCDSNEEFYAGLCYRTCKELTGGTHPIRTSSWTCCVSHPCGVRNQRGEMGHTILCNGFDVSGSGGCPHAPGACLRNEELLLGQCYKQCSQLTDGQFPNRIAPATCCMDNGLGCLDVRRDRTRAGYDVGGGGEDFDPSTPSQAHPPLTNLTERGPTTLVPSTPDPSVVGGHVPGTGQCGVDEELYAGLCYRRCALLTDNAYPIRTSTWTCCAYHPCGLSNQRGSVGHTVLCNGFDVSGDGGCPGRPGECIPSEEKLYGVCYERCSLLTNGEFNFRVAAATCCREDRLRACLDVRKDATSQTYDVSATTGPPQVAVATTPGQTSTAAATTAWPTAAAEAQSA